MENPYIRELGILVDKYKVVSHHLHLAEAKFNQCRDDAKIN